MFIRSDTVKKVHVKRAGAEPDGRETLTSLVNVSANHVVVFALLKLQNANVYHYRVFFFLPVREAIPFSRKKCSKISRVVFYSLFFLIDGASSSIERINEYVFKRRLLHDYDKWHSTYPDRKSGTYFQWRIFNHFLGGGALKFLKIIWHLLVNIKGDLRDISTPTKNPEHVPASEYGNPEYSCTHVVKPEIFDPVCGIIPVRVQKGSFTGFVVGSKGHKRDFEILLWIFRTIMNPLRIVKSNNCVYKYCIIGRGGCKKISFYIWIECNELYSLGTICIFKKINNHFCTKRQNAITSK